MEQLYRDNRGLIGTWKRHYARLCNVMCAPEDLEQAGFIGLSDAAKTWDPARGAWSTWASFHIRGAMIEALGLRRKQLKTVSLDMPLSEDSDADTLAELVADDSIPPASEALELEAIEQAIHDAVAAIGSTAARRAIECVYLKGMNRREAAEEMQIPETSLGNLLRKGLRCMFLDKRLREAVLDEETLFHAYKGVAAFERDMTSVVEAAVIWRERWQESGRN